LPQNVYPAGCPDGHLQLESVHDYDRIRSSNHKHCGVIISYSFAGGNVGGSGGTGEGEDNGATERSELHKRVSWPWL